MFATNSSFKSKVKKVTHLLKPNYTLPIRKIVPVEIYKEKLAKSLFSGRKRLSTSTTITTEDGRIVL